MRTFMAKKEEVKRRWVLVDARERVLGRLASRIATVLQGKHKPTYTPHVDTGDFVVVVNAEKVRVTGRKREQRMYQRYSYHPGGLKQIPLGRMLREKPTEVIRLAVRRMLPKNKLARHMLKKLKVYPGPDHPHEAQRPEAIEL